MKRPIQLLSTGTLANRAALSDCPRKGSELDTSLVPAASAWGWTLRSAQPQHGGRV